MDLEGGEGVTGAGAPKSAGGTRESKASVAPESRSCDV